MPLNEFYARPSVNGSVELCSTETSKVLSSLRLVPAQAVHRNFILSTWVQSYSPINRKIRYHCGEYVYKVSHKNWVRMEQALSAHYFDQGKCWVLLAEDDDITIHGWVCGTKGALHHCYVQKDLRRHGVADAMIRIVCGDELVFTRPWPGSPMTTWEFVPMSSFMENADV